MVNTFGKDIVGGYVNGVQVISIYANGVLVWPDASYYYIKWYPSESSYWGSIASFSINGSTYIVRDYNGDFRDYGGVITESAFSTLRITTLDTNAYRIESYAFNSCERLGYATLRNCNYIGDSAFESCKSSSFSLSAPKCTYVGSNAFHSIGLSRVYLPRCSYVGQSAFRSCTSLTSISLPNCEYVDSRAFGGCGISSVYLPVCSYVGSYAFNANPLQSVNLPECEYVGDGALAYADNITYLSLPKCKYLGEKALKYYLGKSQHSLYLPMCEYVGDAAVEGEGATWMYTVDLPVCSYIGASAFANQNNLDSISLPMCEYIGTSAFLNTAIGGSLLLPACTFIDSWAFWHRFNTSFTSVYLPALVSVSLRAFNETGVTYVSLPVCEYIGVGVFASCRLQSVELPVCSVLCGNAFGYNPSLSEVTLGYSSVCELVDGTVFQATLIDSGTGSIYVPSSLVDAYKSASYWSVYSSQIFPIQN